MDVKIKAFLMLGGRAEEEIKRLFARLSKHRKVLIPLAGYGFSKKFGWLEDCF